jgi:hypothetical protein
MVAEPRDSDSTSASAGELTMWNKGTDKILEEILLELRTQTALLEKLVPGRPDSLQVNFGKPIEKEK